MQLKVTGLSESKMAILKSAKMASQKRISVKDGDEAKEQFSKVINLETVMKKSSAILTSV